MKRKSVISLILRVGAKPLENGFIPPLDGSDGDVAVRVPEFYMCIKDTGTKYQLWISDFNIDGTFTRVHSFIISHTKTMTRTREDGKEEVFSACIKPNDTRYLGGNKSSSVNAIKLQGRPRTGINYDKANEFCANRGDWDRWTVFNGNNPIAQTYWTAEHNIGNGSTNGDHYEVGNYNTDGSNLSTYPAVYRGILNFFGDIWTFIRDIVVINKDKDYNAVYLLKKGVNHSDVTKDNVNEKCYLIGHQANTNNFITEFDFQSGTVDRSSWLICFCFCISRYYSCNSLL